MKPRGHRRYVTVLFADVSGSSEHAERLEAEEYADLLAQFREFARQIVTRHGGTIAASLPTSKSSGLDGAPPQTPRSTIEYERCPVKHGDRFWS